MGTKRRSAVRGVSELVVILALIAVVVPLILVLQSWLSSRASTLESVTVVQPLTGYLVGRTYSGGTEVLTFGVRNQARDTFTIANNGIRAVLSNGSVVSATVVSPTPPISIPPGSEVVITARVGTVSASVRTIAIVISATDSTNRRVELTISLS
ncbi:MAG: hypothetical protein LM571_03790 [Desulfurococcaceae archaeon]|nr:hypothetical protein [Desulfurococcaceae archaeon]